MKTEGMVLNRRFFCALTLILALATPAARADVSDYVRLHVVAEDDGAAAQALKLEVRDACLACARALLGDCCGVDEAWDTLNGNLGALADAASARAKALGCDSAVRAETGEFDFPECRYGDVRLPAGRYRALRVVIGEGRGHNWWCVLYPSLCMPEACETGRPVRFYSSIWRWLRGLFGGGA